MSVNKRLVVFMSFYFILEKLQCKTCQSKNPKIEKSTSTIDLSRKTFENKYTETDNTDIRNIHSSPVKKQVYPEHPQPSDRICPFCSKMFQKEIDFGIFERHVEEHFIPDADSYEML